MLVWTIFVVAIVALLSSGIVASKSQSRRRSRAEEAWPEIEAELERRQHLVPGLVEASKSQDPHARRPQPRHLARSRAQHPAGQARADLPGAR
jgi:hypothetical protein